MAGRRGGGIRWNTTQLHNNLDDMERKFQRALVAAIDYSATRSEAYMKTNARWTDRTTNARNGLHTAPFHSRTSHGYHLAHGVPYGIWLEVRWNARYGIIPQATREGGMMVMSLLTRLFAGLDQM